MTSDMPAGDDDPHGACRHHRGPTLRCLDTTAQTEVRQLVETVAALGGRSRLGFHRFGLCCQAVRLTVAECRVQVIAEPGRLADLPNSPRWDAELAMTIAGWSERRTAEHHWFEIAADLPDDLDRIANAVAVAVTTGLQAEASTIEIEARWQGPFPPSAVTDDHDNVVDTSCWLPLDVEFLRSTPLTSGGEHYP